MPNALLLYPDTVDPHLHDLIRRAVTSNRFTLLEWEKDVTTETKRDWIVELMKRIQDQRCLRVIVVMTDAQPKVNQNVIWELGFSIGFQSAIEHFNSSRDQPIGKTIAVAAESAFSDASYPYDLKSLFHVVYEDNGRQESDDRFSSKLGDALEFTIIEEATALRDSFSESLYRNCHFQVAEIDALTSQLWRLLPKSDTPLAHLVHDQLQSISQLRDWCEDFTTIISQSLGTGSQLFRDRFATYARSLFERMGNLLDAVRQPDRAPSRLQVIKRSFATLRMSLTEVYSAVGNERRADALAMRLQSLFDALHFNGSSREFDGIADKMPGYLNAMQELCTALACWIGTPLIDAANDSAGALFQFAQIHYAQPNRVEDRSRAIQEIADLFHWHASLWRILARHAGQSPSIVQAIVTSSSLRDIASAQLDATRYDSVIPSFERAIESAKRASAKLDCCREVCSEIVQHGISELTTPEPDAINRYVEAVNAVLRCCDTVATFNEQASEGAKLFITLIAQQLLGQVKKSRVDHRTAQIMLESAFKDWCTEVSQAISNLSERKRCCQLVLSICCEQCFQNESTSQIADRLRSMIPIATSIASNLYRVEWLKIDAQHKSLNSGIETFARHVSARRDWKSLLKECNEFLQHCWDQGSRVKNCNLPEEQCNAFLSAMYRVQVTIIQKCATDDNRNYYFTGIASDTITRIGDIADAFDRCRDAMEQSGDGNIQLAAQVHPILEKVKAQAVSGKLYITERSDSHDSLQKQIQNTLHVLNAGAWPINFDTKMSAAFVTFFFASVIGLGSWVLGSFGIGWLVAQKQLDESQKPALSIGRLIVDFTDWSKLRDTFLLVGTIGFVATCSSCGRYFWLSSTTNRVACIAKSIVSGLVCAGLVWFLTNFGRSAHFNVKLGSFCLFVAFYACLVVIPRATEIRQWKWTKVITLPIGLAGVFGLIAWFVESFNPMQISWLSSGTIVQTAMRTMTMMLVTATIMVWIRYKTRWHRNFL